MRRLTVFVQGILAFGVGIMMLVSCLMAAAHGGLSVEVAQSVGLLALFLGLLLIIERRTTGRWHRWSRR
ncbi:hypothetical protein EEJ42_08140 [Streptomyces botrytidirepellens]|uniref:Uncharacterized protein n=2 Tax=Streptomyces botrytidirepellens TaxID=2486417 RepID=A0A3M8WU88_9ACTN|nr:hypothetical protein EEJ42_08140 [Streptomyces botrytidirepellens]